MVTCNYAVPLHDRQEQYHHKRMQDGGELNVTNPVYMRKDPGDEDDEDDEEEPLGASLIYTGNAVSIQRWTGFVICFGRSCSLYSLMFCVFCTPLDCE